MQLLKHDLPTPVLLVNLDDLESNIAKLQTAASLARKQLRPHVKAHKCVEIARRQIHGWIPLDYLLGCRGGRWTSDGLYILRSSHASGGVEQYG